ncbi:MAG: hypothetical protein GF398_20120 [Chitinivibrionales bacterium]|nr:hypothetical protein [Chitinivibrionales bacterium]
MPEIKQKVHRPFTVTAITLLVWLLTAANCTRRESISLDVDFSTRPQWQYEAGIRISGTIESRDSLQVYSGSAGCVLTGSQRDEHADQLNITASKIKIKADFLDSTEVEHLTRQLQNARLYFALRAGTIATPDSTELPVLMIGEWDFYRSFSKVVPTLPGGKVRIGSKWDREKPIPLKTRHGDAVGHLYQTYVLDTIFTKDKIEFAVINWDFVYKIEPTQTDSLDLIRRLPLSGKGSGRATINVTGNYLLDAQVLFEVVPQVDSPVKAGWKELVQIRLKDY